MGEDASAPERKRQDESTFWSEVVSCAADPSFWEFVGYTVAGCIRGLGVLIAALLEL
jgi:hypothetical protein